MPDRAISYESVQELIAAVNAALVALGEQSAEGVWKNTNEPPQAVGGFSANEPATPEDGLTFPQAMNKLLFPVLAPTIDGAVTGTVQFKDANPTLELSYTVTPRTAGASLSNVKVDWKKASDPDYRAYTFYDGAVGSQNVTLRWSDKEASINTTNDVLTVRVRATDSAGGTGERLFTVTPLSYSQPILTETAGGTTAAPIVSPPGAVSGFVEVGSVNQVVQRYMRNVSPFVPVSGGSYYLRLSGANQALQPFASGDQITLNNLGSHKTIQGFIRIIDSETPAGVDRQFFNAVLEYRQFYGGVVDFPTNSAGVRALPNFNWANTLGNSFKFTIATTKFALAVPETRTLVSAITANFENITANFTAETILVNDAAGTPVSYRLYKLATAVPLNLEVTFTLS